MSLEVATMRPKVYQAGIANYTEEYNSPPPKWPKYQAIVLYPDGRIKKCGLNSQTEKPEK